MSIDAVVVIFPRASKQNKRFFLGALDAILILIICNNNADFAPRVLKEFASEICDSTSISLLFTML